MSYLYENYIYPNKLTNRMKITLIRAEKESGKEALSTLEADALIKKLKTETKAGHVSTLRAILPQLEGTCAQYEHIDKLPRIYPAVEYSRTQEGERRMKNYNGLVQLEVNRLSGIAEAEYVSNKPPCCHRPLPLSAVPADGVPRYGYCLPCPTAQRRSGRAMPPCFMPTPTVWR